MKLPLNKTSAEQALIRKGWKNRPFSNREDRNAGFPRGVWHGPNGEGPHSLAVAVLLTTRPEVNGKPFAECEDLAAAARRERQERSAARQADRDKAREEARERAELRRRERALA